MTDVKQLIVEFGKVNHEYFDRMKALNEQFDTLTPEEQEEIRKLCGDSPIGALVMVAGASQKLDPGARSMTLAMYVPHPTGREDPLVPKVEALFSNLFASTKPGPAMAIVLQVIASFVRGAPTDPTSLSNYLARRVLEYGEQASVEMNRKMQEMLQKAMGKQAAGEAGKKMQDVLMQGTPPAEPPVEGTEDPGPGTTEVPEEDKA